MTDYKFTNDNITSKRVEKFIDKIDFSYHINTFDYTTMHGHDDYWEFTLLTEGKLNNVLNGQKISVTAGQMFFSTTDDTHYLKKVGSGKIRYINIIARESAIKRLADMFSDSFFTTLQKMSRKQTFPTELTTQVEEIIHQMLLLPEDAYKEYDGLLCGAAMIVMQFLYRKKDWHGTLFAFERMMQITERPETYISETEPWGPLPFDVMSVAYYMTGDYRASAENAEKALSFSPDDERIRKNLEFARAKLGRE